MAIKWRNPLAGTKASTVAIFLLIVLWAFFQWQSETPPPVLDQILVAAFGVWFANEAIDRKNSRRNDDDEDDEDDDDEGS